MTIILSHCWMCSSWEAMVIVKGMLIFSSKKKKAKAFLSMNSLAHEPPLHPSSLYCNYAGLLYQPPTLGTINISALSDTCMHPQQKEIMSFWRNMKQQRRGGGGGGGEGMKSADHLASCHRAAIDHRARFFARRTKWALLTRRPILDTAGGVCTHVSLLRSHCEATPTPHLQNTVGPPCGGYSSFYSLDWRYEGMLCLNACHEA